MTSNKDNPAKGKAFQLLCKELLSKHFGKEISIEVKIPIGNKPKLDHRFDLGTDDRSIICECKSYSWTKSGNVPSAKLGFINEAVFFLSFLRPNTHRYVVLRRAFHKKRNITLAEYYKKRYSSLLGGIKILEIDMESNTVRELS